jgi:hypothetical protein
MDAELRDLLVLRFKVLEETADWLEGIGCVNILLFAAWADTVQDVGALADRGPKKEIEAEKPRLKAAWQRASVMADAANKREAAGLEPADLDVPLPLEQHRHMLHAACALYAFPSFPPTTIMNDGQLGQLRREFKAFSPTLNEIAKIRSFSGKPRKVKRTRISTDLEFLLGDSYEEPEDVTDIWVWNERVTVLATSMAVAGSFKAKTPAGTDEWYVHWSQSQGFFRAFTGKVTRLRTKFTDASVLQYLNDCYEAFFNKAIELAKEEKPVLLGTAMLRSLQEESAIWNTNSDILVKRSGQSPPQGASLARNGERGISFANSSQDRQAKAPASQGSRNIMNKAKTLTSINGEQVCKMFNDSRGRGAPRGRCKNANCKFLHVCDCILASGKNCASKEHSRREHDEKKHGAVALR